MTLTNHPVRKLGPVSYRMTPFAHLIDVQNDARLSLERDLRTAPTPISGGMRKALAKETAQQNGLRFRTRRQYREPDLRRTYGLFQCQCTRCRHVMYFDEPSDDGIICDRCKRLAW